MAEQRQKEKKKSGTALLLMQSAACGVVLLIALVLRLIGGNFYDEVRTAFRDALTDNGIADTVSAWLSSENTHA